MEWFVTGLLAVAALLVLATRKRRNVVSVEEKAPYVLVERLFSPAERSFFGVLEQSLGDEFRIFGKVRVADVLGIATCQTRAAWQKAFNQISGKHFDFLLCRPGDLQPVCAIELNDISHARGKRKRRDDFLHHACAAAGLPLVFFPAQRAYLADDVRGAVAVALGAPEMQAADGDVVFPELLAACRGAGSS
jgi:hypothetical protein